MTNEAKFATFSATSVRNYAAMNGHPDLSVDISKQLAEDTAYRIRMLLQVSFCFYGSVDTTVVLLGKFFVLQDARSFMRHSRRRRLKVSDLIKAQNIQDSPVCLYVFFQPFNALFLG